MLQRFDQSNCSNIARTQQMFKALPLEKRSSFIHFDSWDKFKAKLINEFSNIEVFRHEAFKLFTQMDQPLQKVKELTYVLAPTIKCVATPRSHHHLQHHVDQHHHTYQFQYVLRPTFLPASETFFFTFYFKKKGFIFIKIHGKM